MNPSKYDDWVSGVQLDNKRGSKSHHDVSLRRRQRWINEGGPRFLDKIDVGKTFVAQQRFRHVHRRDTDARDLDQPDSRRLGLGLRADRAIL